ncbi:dihydrolipoyl dehydrogenase [Geomonas azotofigens]|uniref:dihydrolipoyl dehydrogenase n=1 Tax=Geomonas azotofigens TaxID=2843196 RepID=UPI001C10F2DF|nr:dihydrolipoyl dehydrogenase [Geomonas azotofigens]MBU5613872.1 dihydrolipoyl dehydrogenase [Geomonas azotofigens]
MSERYDYDLIVLGAGPGGYVAAIRGAQLGLKTAVVERDKPGGVCLNVGCIPSKALIDQARIFGESAALAEMGVAVDKSRLDYRKVFRKSRAVAAQLSKGVSFLLKKNNVDYMAGSARFVTAHTVSVDGQRTISARNVLIATGSRPTQLKGWEFDEDRVISSTGALMMEELPKRIVILGAGAIGVEFSYVFSSFGVEVTLVEMMDRILPQEDHEACALLTKSFSQKGIKVKTSTKAVGCEKGPAGLKVTLEGQDGARETVEADKVLVAAGRTPNSDGLGLETIGVRTENGYVQVGDHYRTDVPGVYAIGDVIKSPLLAHVASKEGEIAVEHMAGHPCAARVDAELVPFATYCEPQVASFGRTEPILSRAGASFEKAVFPFRAIGKAVAVEKSDGFVKILFDRESKEILGCTIIGSEATELIHEVLLAKQAELTAEELAVMIHAHPSLSEGVMEAARAAAGAAIHI